MILKFVANFTFLVWNYKQSWFIVLILLSMLQYLGFKQQINVDFASFFLCLGFGFFGLFWGFFGGVVWVFSLMPSKTIYFQNFESSSRGWLPVFNEMFFRERFVNGERNVFIIPLYSLQPQEILVLPNNKLYSFIVLRKFTATRIF